MYDESTPLTGSNKRFEEIINFSQVLRAIFHIFLGIMFLLVFILFYGGSSRSSISVAFLFIVLLILYGIYLNGHSRFAGIGLLVSTSVILTYNLSIGNGIRDNAMVALPVLITLGGLLFGKRFLPLMTALIIIEVSVIYTLVELAVIIPFNGVIITDFQDYLTVLIFLFFSGILVWVTINIIERNFLRIIDSEAELRKSYDDTIDGWGRALELFDKETEGHSQRVTDLSLKVAKSLGITGDNLEHIRRGALLHDIGKMGVPEDILNKPGPLTEEERKIIQRHPVVAYNLLKNIPYLQPALSIPYYHHERWDGTGYPRNLREEEIPLEARVFAIVDNWDALLSDRPYRKAWERQQVIDYLKEQSGKMFDPKVLSAFFNIVGQD